MPRRSLLPDLAGLLLLAWAGLLAYVSVPTLLSDDPFWDYGVSVLGAVLGAAHLGAAVGVFLRAWWARQLGLVLGFIGLFGSGAVLVGIASGLGRAAALMGDAMPLTVLAIPAGMLASYAIIVVVLYRARPEFSPPT